MAVAAFLQMKDQREALYRALIESGDEAEFAVPLVAGFVADKTQDHWKAGAPYAAPMGAVSWLREMGPRARAAVPALVVALEYPDRWDFVLAVAEALGAIGPDAREAVPALLRAARTDNYRVRTATREALEQIGATEEANALLQLERVLGQGDSSVYGDGFRHIYLTQGNLDDATLKDFASGLKVLGVSQNVVWLDLSNARISDDALALLRDLPNLEWLTLRSTGISDEGILHLEVLPRLERLDLHSTAVSPEAINKLRTARPGMTILP